MRNTALCPVCGNEGPVVQTVLRKSDSPLFDGELDELTLGARCTYCKLPPAGRILWDEIRNLERRVIENPGDGGMRNLLSAKRFSLYKRYGK